MIFIGFVALPKFVIINARGDLRDGRLFVEKHQNSRKRVVLNMSFSRAAPDGAARAWLTSAGALVDLGAALGFKGRLDEAIAEYRTALHQRPGSPMPGPLSNGVGRPKEAGARGAAAGNQSGVLA